MKDFTELDKPKPDHPDKKQAGRPKKPTQWVDLGEGIKAQRIGPQHVVIKVGTQIEVVSGVVIKELSPESYQLQKILTV